MVLVETRYSAFVRKGNPPYEHRDGKGRSKSVNGAVVCARCQGFIVIGERGPLPFFCSCRCRVASWRARRPGAGAPARAREVRLGGRAGTGQGDPQELLAGAG